MTYEITVIRVQHAKLNDKPSKFLELFCQRLDTAIVASQAWLQRNF